MLRNPRLEGLGPMSLLVSDSLYVICGAENSAPQIFKLLRYVSFALVEIDSVSEPSRQEEHTSGGADE